MYIPIQKEEKPVEFNNFLGDYFGKEQTFGDQVAADIDALNGAGKDRAFSKTTKAIIGVSVAAVVVFVGYKMMKKRK